MKQNVNVINNQILNILYFHILTFSVTILSATRLTTRRISVSSTSTKPRLLSNCSIQQVMHSLVVDCKVRNLQELSVLNVFL